VDPSEPIAPLLYSTTPGDPSLRAYSAFSLSGHMQKAVLRLVSLNSFLTLNLSLLRIAEIHDTFVYKCFISRKTLTSAVISRIIDELGLPLSISIPGGGALEYVLEEVWTDGPSESMLIPFLLVLMSF